MVYACLICNSAKDMLKDVGIQVGNKLAQASINRITGVTIMHISNAVGVRLLYKDGITGVVSLDRTIPLLCGVIGGTVDAATTSVVGSVAISAFIADYVHCTGSRCLTCCDLADAYLDGSRPLCLPPCA